MNKVKDLRKQADLSQSQFAEKYGIPVPILKELEQGAAEPLPYLMALIQDGITDEEYIDVFKYFIHLKTYSKFVGKESINIHSI